MGTNTSKTRRLTVENNDPTSVIKVSDDVVDRIRGLAQTVRSPEHLPNISTQGAATTVPVYLYEPSLTSLQLRQANIADLKKNDEYWSNRLNTLEENHKKINIVLDEEYKKALDEFQTGKSVQTLKEIPCLDSKRAVMDCYRKNLDCPMNCTKIVQAFQECVDHKRTCLLASRVATSKG
ncbi:MICOS complex subunit MIC19-like [Prorops nasuta]|uniref:MICOS complex subunit MIC19 n=1 Tax=Hypothenemus hampei TaxID=57062 RepID=A0ABD1FDE9_HYPHA